MSERLSSVDIIDEEPRGFPEEPYLALAVTKLEHLLRARAVLWRATVAAAKPDHLWGMPQVSDGEVEQMAPMPPLGPARWSRETPVALVPHFEAARAAEAALCSTARQAVGGGLRAIERVFHLDPVARDVLVLAALPELDQRYRRLLGYLMDDASQPWGSLELAVETLAPVHASMLAVRTALCQSAPLLRHGLIHLVEPLGGSALSPRAQHGLRIAPAVLPRLLGLGRGAESPDAVLERLPIASNPLHVEKSTHTALESIASLLQADEADRVLLHGSGVSGSGAVAWLARELGVPATVMHADRALRQVEPVSARLVEALRDARLEGALLCIRSAEPLFQADHADALSAFLSALEDHPLPVLIECRDEPPHALAAAERAVVLEVPRPGWQLREALWSRHLETAPLDREADTAALADELADSFNLTGEQVEAAMLRASSIAALRYPTAQRIGRADLMQACRETARPDTGGLARRISPTAAPTEADLVLPGNTLERLTDMRRRIRYRARTTATLDPRRRLTGGRGLLALFSGASGTGKTMAATMLAGATGRHLLVANLATLVSKWVGETEKQLERLFDETEATNAILFFDEAEALFSRRGEVKEAKDRWANLETNYLLQRIETVDAAIILATNLRQNVDSAFMRRIDVAIDFPFPDEALRFRLWRRMIPPRVTPPLDADLHELARTFELSGGNIRNIVVDALHRAFAERIEAGDEPLDGLPGFCDDSDGSEATPVLDLSLSHLVKAAAREYEKLGRPPSRMDFGERLYACLRQGGTDGSP